MAVIINELEVVVESHPPAAEGSTASAQQAPQPFEPLDLLDMEERQQFYRLRTLAH